MPSKNSQDELNWVIAAGIVGADIGTSIFYGTGILFPIVGYYAPLFVLTCCLMMWLFKRTYEEGLAMSPYNGGAYSMILRSVGRRGAVLAGALTFVSYLATAAVSALAGSFYLSSLFPSLSSSHIVLLSFIPIAGFGILNTKGIKEPAKLVTLIAGLHFLLLIIIAVWGGGFLITHWDSISFQRFTSPTISLSFSTLMYGFASAFLGITGFESAAQIVEELETPTLTTVHKLYKTVIILVSLTAPAISFLCLILLSPLEIQNNLNYLLSGLAMKLGGKSLLTIIVIDATLTLYAAVNTAFVGFIGLAKTMAKQGNLPEKLLWRVAHIYPNIKGYPLISLPFAGIALTMSALVAGEVGVLAKVYEIAFLGVMVSFCIGVILLRNQPLKKDTPKKYLSNLLLVFKGKATPTVISTVIPVVPLFSGIVLAIASTTLLAHSQARVLLMLVFLLALTLLLMAYYRWGLLESRLESRHDLRLGLGKFKNTSDLPNDLPHYILCTGNIRGHWLINKTLKHILKYEKNDFEFVIFHAEEGKDKEGFFFEQIQRIVSQQVAPLYNHNIILTVKVLPGTLSEGLHTLQKQYKFKKAIIGMWHHSEGKAVKDWVADLATDLDIPAICMDDFLKQTGLG